MGYSGTILRTTNGGTNWTPQTSGTTKELNGVFFTDTNNGIVVGEFGTILRTTDAGTTWTIEETSTTNFLSGVFFTDANTGTIVGEGGIILRTSVPPAYITANLKVYLEGPYNGSGGMTTTLNTNNLNSA